MRPRVQILKSFIEVIHEQTDIFIEAVGRLAEQSGDAPFNICGPITLCTLDIIGETAMGCSLNGAALLLPRLS